MTVKEPFHIVASILSMPARAAAVGAGLFVALRGRLKL